jgi:hypothetical protein
MAVRQVANAQCRSILARHKASKVSVAVVGAHACESNGSPGFSWTALASSVLESGFAAVCAGHSSNDFESMGLPSYQHLRPSMSRHDQYPWFDGAAALHCCFACAMGVEINAIVVKQAARTVGGRCFVIGGTQDYFVAAIEFGQPRDQVVREPPPTASR